jgi:hypothetical protein
MSTWKKEKGSLSVLQLITYLPTKSSTLPQPMEEAEQ